MCLCLPSLKLSNWISSQKERRGGVGGLCQVHHKLSYTTFQDVKTFAGKKKQLKEDGGSVQHAGQKQDSSCNALESAGNRNERADL